MNEFEGEYKNLRTRIFSLENIGVFLLFIYFSYIFCELEYSKLLTFTIIIFGFLIYIFLIIDNSRNYIQSLIFEENTILLKGERFNKEWKTVLDIKQTFITVKGKASRRGLCGVVFYIRLKNKKDAYTITSFSEEQIIEIFNEFKRLKGEKIIIDEQLYISRIQEKIEKCQ